MTELPTTADTTPEEVDDGLDRMLSLTEVCDYEGVSRWTVQRRIRAGAFPAGLEQENGRPGWPFSWLKARRKEKLRRTLGAEAAPAPEAA